MKNQFRIMLVTMILSGLLLSVGAFAQSKIESRPTPVSGNSIQATLIDDNPSSYQTYYYSLELAAGRYKAVLKSKTKECDGSGVSVYVDGFANVFTSACDGATNTATAELDFELKRSGKHLVTLYLNGGDNERYEIDLSFISSGGNSSPAQTAKGQVCTYSDNFSLSDAKPRYERIFEGLVFRKGSAQMFITAINEEGTNISGTVYAEQTDKGRNNENFVLPVDGFGGTIGTPLRNEPVREVQQISGNGKGFIKILFEQNGNGAPKKGYYKLVVQGDGIVSCGTTNGTAPATSEPGKKRGN